jgi:hypothetical protein
MSNVRFAALTLGTVLLIAACTAAGGSPGGGSPGSGTPAPSSPPPGIEHGTGASEVLLRMATGGGFVAPGFLATEAPEFTLYGDGTVVFRDPADQPPVAEADPVVRFALFKTARLSEAQIQDLLAFAIGPSGLGIARAQYDPCCIADAPSTRFTLRAGGLDKTVSVGALGFDEPQPGPDTAARKAFTALRDRLVDLDTVGGLITVERYRPAAYRGFLLDGGPPAPGGGAIDWPWTAFGPDDFSVPADPNAYQMGSRTLTAADVAALGLVDLEGGAQGIPLRGPGTKAHILSLRPLLPDDTN